MQSTITENGALFHAQRRARIVKVRRVIRRAERGDRAHKSLDAHPPARRRVIPMTRINGTEEAVYDPTVAQGYVRVSAALVDAACDAWLARKGISYQSLGRAGLSNKLRERASQDRKRHGNLRRSAVRDSK